MDASRWDFGAVTEPAVQILCPSGKRPYVVNIPRMLSTRRDLATTSLEDAECRQTEMELG